MITGIIMASGLSKRYGNNKLLEEINLKPVYQYSFKNITKSKIKKLIVVTSFDEIIEYSIKKNIPYVINYNPELGQSESIKLGIINASIDTNYMFFVADQPLLKVSTINSLIDKFYKHKTKIIVPTHKNSQGNPKIFPNYFRDSLLSLKGDNGGRILLEKNLDRVYKLEIDDYKSFLDIDTKNDLKTIKKYYKLK